MRFLPKAGILPRMERLGPRRAWPLVLLAALACATRPAAPPAPKDTGLLAFWQVESTAQPGGRAWLLGSVHGGTPNLQFDPAVEGAFEVSDALVIEADITAIGGDGQGFIQRTLQAASLPEGKTLDQVLPKPTWEKLGEFLHARGQSVEDYRRFEPWLVMTVVTSFLFAEAGLPATGGVDLRLASRAEGKIPIIPLESPEYQITLLDALPLDVQTSILDQVLSRQGETRAVSERTFEAWRLGDLDAVEAEVAPPARDAALRDFHERVYLARNRAMVERLDQLLHEPKTWFVVLGVGHMVGDEGIPKLLEAKGYRVTRVARTAAPADPAGPAAPAAPAAPATP
jgi:uncharacterized protein YbaP (TraB family)